MSGEDPYRTSWEEREAVNRRILEDQRRYAVDDDPHNAPKFFPPNQQGFIRMGQAVIFSLIWYGCFEWLLGSLMTGVPQRFVFLHSFLLWTGQVFIVGSAFVVFRFLRRVPRRLCLDTFKEIGKALKWMFLWACLSVVAGVAIGGLRASMSQDSSAPRPAAIKEKR